MNTKLTKMIMSSLALTCALVCLVAAMVLGTSSTTRAASRAPQSCSASTLNGLYLWTMQGYDVIAGNIVGGASGPKAVLEGLTFNGDGTLTVPFGWVSLNGHIINAAGSAGTYTVAADCTGTLSITNGPGFNIYVASSGQQLWLFNTTGPTPQQVAVGTAIRLE